MNYRDYQIQTMRECIADAITVIETGEHYDFARATELAVAMFALRCQHKHYWDEEIKKEFKDNKGMTTDELALSAKHECDCCNCDCGGKI